MRQLIVHRASSFKSRLQLGPSGCDGGVPGRVPGLRKDPGELPIQEEALLGAGTPPSGPASCESSWSASPPAPPAPSPPLPAGVEEKAVCLPALSLPPALELEVGICPAGEEKEKMLIAAGEKAAKALPARLSTPGASSREGLVPAASAGAANRALLAAAAPAAPPAPALPAAPVPAKALLAELLASAVQPPL